jgi:predicted transposase/invertase (TIGR01784 family)
LIQADEAIRKVTSSEAFRELERMREKAALDFEQARYSAEKRGERRGRKEGRLEGIQEGRLEGRLEGILQTAGNMLTKGLSDDLISEFTGLSLTEIRELRSSYGHRDTEVRAVQPDATSGRMAEWMKQTNRALKLPQS